jgi:hypothetical protein
MIFRLTCCNTATLGLLLLVGCGGGQSTAEKPAATAASPSTPAPVATSTNPAGPTATAPAATKASATATTIAPGVYCYSTKMPTLTAVAEFQVDASRKVMGKLRGRIHAPDSDYYAAYVQTLSGTLTSDQANMAIVTEIEGDRQNATETWIVTADTLKTKRETLTTTDCGQLEKILAAAPTPGSQASPAANPASSVPETVSFAPGSSATTLKGAVIRGERKTYILNAAKNQTMTIDIGAIENNAVFDLIGPDGKTLKQEASSVTQVLPANGNYQIIIGGTRGNASYDLTVSIK